MKGHRGRHENGDEDWGLGRQGVMPGRGVWLLRQFIYSYQQYMYPYSDSFWVWALSSVPDSCHTTRLWLLLPWSNVTPCRFAISVQKLWKTLEHAVFQNISERTNLRSIAQWPSSLHYHFQIKRNSPDYSGICCLLCSFHLHNSSRKIRGQSRNFHIWSGRWREGEKKCFSQPLPWMSRDIHVSGF